MLLDERIFLTKNRIDYIHLKPNSGIKISSFEVNNLVRNDPLGNYHIETPKIKPVRYGINQTIHTKILNLWKFIIIFSFFFTKTMVAQIA